MPRRANVGHGSKPASALAAIALGILVMGAGQAAPEIGNASLYAIGVVTPNVEETAQQYERVLGVKAVAMATSSNLSTNAEPSGKKVTTKMSVVALPNFYIKLFEPVSQNGPYAEQLRKHGLSIQDSQLFVEGDVDHIQAVRAELQRRGGRWTLGSPKDFWAYVDFQDKLGTTLEPINIGRRPLPIDISPDATLPALGTMPVSHIGVVALDVHKTARAYSDVFGIPMPKVLDLQAAPFAAATASDRKVRLELARWRQGDIGIELIGSVGVATPWSEFASKHGGPAAHIVAFAVGDRRDGFLRDLQAKGGKLIHSGPTGGPTYVDFSDTLGVVIALEGTSQRAAAGK